jgi:hypothetical protein
MLKKLSNFSEMQVFEQIEPVAKKYGATVYRKVRIADVVDIAKLRIYHLSSYALKAHFDFVIADEAEYPLFAVEFDGPGHSGEHDEHKNQICRQSSLALFRVDIRASHLATAKLTLLEYLVNLFFLALAFDKMQSEGTLAPDEPFMISGFLKPNARNIFDSEFDLLGIARGKLFSYCSKNNISGGPL